MKEMVSRPRMLPTIISRSTEIICSRGDALALLTASSSSMRRDRTLRRMAVRKNGFCDVVARDEKVGLVSDAICNFVVVVDLAFSS